MNENDFLKNFAKVLGAETKFEELEEKRLKEKRMLEGLSARFGIGLVEEEVKEIPPVFIQQPVVESEPVEEEVVPELIEEAVVVQEQVEEIVENVIPPLPQLPVKTIVSKSVEMISKAVDTQAAVDKIDDPLRRELDAMKKTIADLHRYARNTSQMGGGGAGDILNLDHHTTLVTTSYYNVGRKDYYIGVNCQARTTIILPAIVANGRNIIIKDESGHCARYPIIVQGNIDNDVNGFILRINNGGIHMIYRDGWRIV